MQQAKDVPQFLFLDLPAFSGIREGERLTTTLLSGRVMQPAQDWLPRSIPHTYLIIGSSCEDISSVVFITHLLLLALARPCIFSDTILRLGSVRTPTSQGERQLILDRQSGLGNCFSSNCWLLQQASSTLFAPLGRGAVLLGRSLFSFRRNRPHAGTQALPLLPSLDPSLGFSFACLLPNYYMSRLTECVQEPLWRGKNEPKFDKQQQDTALNRETTMLNLVFSPSRF